MQKFRGPPIPEACKVRGEKGLTCSMCVDRNGRIACTACFNCDSAKTKCSFRHTDRFKIGQYVGFAPESAKRPRPQGAAAGAEPIALAQSPAPASDALDRAFFNEFESRLTDNLEAISARFDKQLAAANAETHGLRIELASVNAQLAESTAEASRSNGARKAQIASLARDVAAVLARMPPLPVAGDAAPLH